MVRSSHGLPAARRGGARPGAGRPPTFGQATSVRSFTLDEQTIAAITRWQAEHATSSASEALRQMVDVAHRVDLGLSHPCPVCGEPMQSWRPGATCRLCRSRKGGLGNRRRSVPTSAQTQA
jgi:hypothetical protein